MLENTTFRKLGLLPSSGQGRKTSNVLGPLERVNLSEVRFEVFTAVTMKNCVFWDVSPCGAFKNRRLGGTLAVTGNRRTLRRNTKYISSQRTSVARCSLCCSSETSVLTRATRHNNPEDTILHSHRRVNLKSYK
jgi:hypothetical protein